MYKLYCDTFLKAVQCTCIVTLLLQHITNLPYKNNYNKVILLPLLQDKLGESVLVCVKTQSATYCESVTLISSKLWVYAP